MPSKSHVSAAKKADVMKLLDFVDWTASELEWYNVALSKKCVKSEKTDRGPREKC